jgi:uncharacterized membrane protein
MSGSHHLVGIAVAMASAVLYNVGFILEKRALGSLPEVHVRRLGHLLRSLGSSPLWLGGFSSIMVGLGLQVVALSLVPVSVVQPIFVSGIVLLIAASRFVLGETFGRTEQTGLALVAVALLAVSLSLDPHADRAGTSGTLVGVLGVGLPTVLMAAWVFMSADRLAVTAGSRAHLQAPLYGLSTGLVYGVAALATKAVSSLVEQHGLIAAIPKALASPYLYILGVSSAAGLLLFQTALQRCQASVVVPVSNVISSTYLAIVGTILFGEHLPAAHWRLALRLVGFVGVLAGMAMLAGARGLNQSYPQPARLAEQVAVEGDPV